MDRMRVVLADDEPLARMRLARLLGEAGCEVISEFADGEDLLAWLRTGGTADAMFLDIQMPEATGLDVLAELDDPPPTVFVTTYSEHAVKAFESAALDYLLKPVSKERVLKTLARIRAARPELGRGEARARAGASKVPVRAGDGVVLVELRRASHFEVEDKTVWVWCGKDRLPTPWTSLGEVERMFPGCGLLRIQRNLMIRPEAILGVRSLGGGRLQVRMADGHDLDVSRSSSPRLRELLGLGNLGVVDPA